MKILNIVFIVLFLLSAALQYNDPDPFVWIPIYLWGAILCFLAIRGKYFPSFYYLGLLVFIVYGSYLFFSKTGVWYWWTEHDAENIVQSMKATKPWIEETREFFGLLLLIISLVLNMIWLKNKRKAEKTSA